MKISKKKSKEIIIYNYYKYQTNITYVYYLFLIMQFLPIYIGILDKNSLTLTDQTMHYLKILSFISPYTYFKTNLLNNAFLPYLPAILYSCTILLIFLFKLISNVFETNKLIFLLLYVYTNCLELIIYSFSISINFILFFLLGKIIQNSNQTDIYGNLHLFLAGTIYTLVYLVLKYIHIKSNCHLLTFRKTKIYFKDSLFSPKYHYFLFFLEILVSLKDCLTTFNQSGSFIHALLVIVVILFNTYIFIHFFQRKILFIINYKFNMIRLILSQFIFFQVLFSIYFKNSNLFTFCVIPSLLLSISTSIYFTNTSFLQIFKSSDRTLQYLHLINEVALESSRASDVLRLIEYENDYTYLNTGNNLINVCVELLNQIQEAEEAQDVLLSHGFLNIFEFSKLVLLRISNTNVNKFIFSIKNELNKQYNLIDDYENNCVCLYLSTNLTEIQSNTKFNDTINNYLHCNKLFENLLNEFTKILENNKIIFNYNFYSSIGLVSKAKKDLCSKLINIYKNKNIHFDNFNFIILSLTYEYIYKENIKQIDATFSRYDMIELVDYHYNTDNFLFFRYNIDEGQIRLSKYAKNIQMEPGERIEMMLPPILGNIIKKSFIKAIEEAHSNQIDLIYYDDTNFTIRRFLYDFQILQSMNGNVVNIFGVYKFKKDNILITRVIDNVEYIEMYSLTKWIDLIGVNISLIETFLKRKISPRFKDFFNLRTDNFELRANSESLKIFQFNIDLIKLHKVDNFINDATLPEISMSLLKEYTNEKFYFKIYLINTLKFSMIKNEKSKAFFKRNTLIKTLKKYLMKIINMNDVIIDTVDKDNTNKLVETYTKYNEKKKKKFGKLNSIKIFLNLMITLYCGIFIIIGYSNTVKIQNFFVIKTHFEGIKYFWSHTIISIFQNILIFKEGTEDVSNYFQPGADYFAKFNSVPGIDVSIAGVCVEELKYKIDFLKTIINEFEITVSSGELSSEIVQAFSEPFDLYYMRGDSDLYVTKGSYEFFDATSYMLNWAYTVFEPNTSFTSVWIVSFFYDKFDLSNITNPNLKDWQHSIYDITFNYLAFQKRFEKISDVINTSFDKLLSDYSTLNAYLTMLLLVLHLLYFLNCLLILISFNMKVQKYILIITYLMNEENILSLKRKIFNLKLFNKLYVDHSMKIIRELDRQNQKSKLMNFKTFVQKGLSKFDGNLVEFAGDESESVDFISDVKIMTNLNIKSKINLINPFLKVLIIVLLLYLVFYSTTYYLQTTFFDTFILVNKYSLTFITLQIKNSNNAALIQSKTQNNETDFMLNEFMNEVPSKGYIRSGFDYSFSLIDELKQLETSSSLSGMPSLMKSATDCKKVYKMTDMIYRNFNETVISSLINFCHTYSFTKSSNFYNYNFELLYLETNLLNYLEEADRDYTKTKQVWDLFAFFDQLVINNMIMRPINDYLYYDVINNLVLNSINQFNSYNLSYLICTMLVDVIILTFMYYKVVKKVRSIENEIKQFIILI